VFMVVLILFIFGGEILRSFSLAMLIGVVFGVYSTLFIASPIVVDTMKKKPEQTPAKPVAQTHKV
jgi:SecD/SecF fusion protein